MRQMNPLSLRMACPHPPPQHTHLALPSRAALPAGRGPALPMGLSACNTLCLLASEAATKWAGGKSEALG